MIDLHTHTNESDGSCTPLELVDRAIGIGLEALAISDHDTFAGYDQAAGPARGYGLDLVCAVELSARMDGGGRRPRTIHLLGYFLHQPPSPEFRSWLEELLLARRERNRRLAAKLQSLGMPIELSEVERLGRTLTGRPHFARVLVQKGYAANSEEAFRAYLGESAPAYVERDVPDAASGIQRITAGAGLPVLAHPVRLGIRDPLSEESVIRELRDCGLRGIEVFHSDHNDSDQQRYREVARKLGLAITGGSDFHGDAKPRIELGSGINGSLEIPKRVLEDLRSA